MIRVIRVDSSFFGTAFLASLAFSNFFTFFPSFLRSFPSYFLSCLSSISSLFLFFFLLRSSERRRPAAGGTKGTRNGAPFQALRLRRSPNDTRLITQEFNLLAVNLLLVTSFYFNLFDSIHLLSYLFIFLLIRSPLALAIPNIL